MLMHPPPTRADDDAQLPARSAPYRDFGRATWRRLSWLIGMWIERRRQRLYLAELDDRLLDDIGVTPAEAGREAAKPFWR